MIWVSVYLASSYRGTERDEKPRSLSDGYQQTTRRRRYFIFVQCESHLSLLILPEKAYRKASKSLTDTSATHSALIHLQQSLSTDVQRANADHLALLWSKQGSLLLSVAARSGSLGAGLTHFHSESFKSAAGCYKDIEYCKLHIQR
jgi:hypothetical protein